MRVRPLVSRPLLSGMLLCLWAGQAQASFDFGCSIDWRIDAQDQSLCSNLPFLSPGNDSRVNIQLLLSESGVLPLPQALPREEDDLLSPDVPFHADDLLRAIRPPEAAREEVAKEEGARLQALADDLGLDEDLSAPLFAEHEGTRCRSNSAGSAIAFATALENTSLPSEVRRSLTRQRLSLLRVCGPAFVVLEPEAPGPQPEAVAFMAYLRAAEAFYGGELIEAGEGFAALEDNTHPWLRETARYMRGRVLLNQAVETGLDEYGYMEQAQVSPDLADAALEAFQQYLVEHPDGLYSISARGLLRRLHWLKGDNVALANEFAWQWQQSQAQRNLGVAELIEEFDGKLLFAGALEDVRDPLLLATRDLIRLRGRDDGVAALPRELLEQQKAFFIDQPRLHRYLVAAQRLYGEGDAEASLAVLPAAPAQGPLGLLAFSEQTLRGLALERLGRHQAAREHWRALLPLSEQPMQRAQLQLALAMNLERSGQVAEVFAEGSPIDAQPVRLQLLRFVADAGLLRQEARKSSGAARERILYTLYYKDLLRGHYADFLRDSEEFGTPGGESLLAPFAWNGDTRGHYSCPTLKQVAGQLAEDPQDQRALVCLGDWVRTQDMRYSPQLNRPSAKQLGGSEDLFPGQAFSRLQAYQAVIADRDAAMETQAYALYRAVYCFAPAGNNDCDSQEIDPQQRKAWFNQLKREHAGSHWASALRYHW